MTKVDILIIGGGVTGLSLGAFLKDKDYIIIDKESEVGGYCKTTIRNGYVWDYSGHFFHFNDASIQDFVTKNITCEIKSVNKISKIFYNEKTIDFPFQSNISQLDKEEFIECLLDIYNREDINVENFKDLSYSQFGKAISNKFIVPYNEKLYACDLSKLDHECMGRFLPKVNFNDVMKTINGVKYKSYNDTFIYPEYGCQEFIKSICCDVDMNQVKLNENVIKIDLDNKVVYTENNEYQFNTLVSTLPFNFLLKITGEKVESELNSNKVVVFNIGFDKPSTTDAHWIYYPGNEVFYRVGFYNNILSNDKMSIYVEIGMDSKADVDESYLFNKVISDLKKCGVITNQSIVDYQMLILNPAYVHITKESMKIYNDWVEKNNKNNIYSIGRYGSWTYCSIEDNIIQSKKISELI